jgi:Transposase DNA-binding
MSHVATDTNWAVREFADAELGDERRTKRLVELANVLGQHPTAALPAACGDGGMLKAAYRFFDHDAIDAQDLLQSHIESTYRRLDQVSVVLAVQDTTEVNWTGHPATQGLGPLGHTYPRTYK